VTKQLQLGSCSFYYNVSQCLVVLLAKFDYKIRRGPLDRGTQIGVGWFSIEFAMCGNGAK